MNDVTERGGFVFFWNGWPSQWYPSVFVVDGVTYSCAEQFMMAEKARLRVEREFSWTSIARQTLGFYEDLVAAHASRRGK